MTCTFFGHRDTPKEIEPILVSTLKDLIENKNVNKFYVGNHGDFDFLVRKNLEKLKKQYPSISYYIVLAYLPQKKSEIDFLDYSLTVYPDGLEKIPYKLAIIKRNQWMIEHSDFVVVYVKNSVGGAAKFKELAEKRGKKVTNCYDDK